MPLVGYSPAPDPKATDRMDHVAFRTEDCAALRNYVGAKGVKVPYSVPIRKDGSSELTVHDPEGHMIEFVQVGSAMVAGPSSTGALVRTDPVSRRMIHAGFLVHDRAAEDHFYQNILG